MLFVLNARKNSVALVHNDVIGSYLQPHNSVFVKMYWYRYYLPRTWNRKVGVDRDVLRIEAFQRYERVLMK